MASQIKILKGSAVTQIMLGGLTRYPPVTNYISAKSCCKNKQD